MISFITVTYNSSEVIRGALASVREAFRDCEYECIVVDNNSSDGTAELIRVEFPWVRLITSEKNLGFARGNNIAMAAARGDIIWLVNPDLRFNNEVDVAAVDRALAQPDCGMVAGKLLYPDGATQESVRRFPDLPVLLFRGFGLNRLFPTWGRHRRYLMCDMSYDSPQSIEWAIGALLVARREVMWTRMQGFDEAYFMYYEDADLALRMSFLGLKVLYEPSLTATHLYKRESAGRIFSKLKLIHFASIVRFLLTRARIRRSQVIAEP